MSVRLYKEIIEFLEHQKQVIRSFESEREELLHKDTRRFIQTLRENLCLLEENINKIINGSDKDV